MSRSAGCSRWIWNWALEQERKAIDTTGNRIGRFPLDKELKNLKRQPGTAFLAEPSSWCLSQTLIDLDQAFANNRAGTAGKPKFHRRGTDDSFRYPRDFKLAESRNLVFLPKIGWVKYINTRRIAGRPRSITVSREAGNWYMSVLAEEDIPDPVHPHPESAVGIDLGVKLFAALSDGTVLESLRLHERFEAKLAKLQRKLARKEKRSRNRDRLVVRIQRLYRRIANVRKDFLHKASTMICKNHATVVVEDLRIKNMTKSAKGTLEEPGRNVKAKAGMNRSILSEGWGMFVRMLRYKLERLGGRLIIVPPQYTSQACSRCGFVDAGNRRTQAKFRCLKCGLELNADFNAALNILAAGLAVTACGAGTPAAKQEPPGRGVSNGMPLSGIPVL